MTHCTTELAETPLWKGVVGSRTGCHVWTLDLLRFTGTQVLEVQKCSGELSWDDIFAVQARVCGLQ
jgi:hypothetical protein